MFLQVCICIGILVEISSNVCDFGGGMENSSHPLKELIDLLDFTNIVTILVQFSPF